MRARVSRGCPLLSHALRLIADLDGAVASFVRGKNRDYKNLVVSFV